MKNRGEIDNLVDKFLQKLPLCSDEPCLEVLVSVAKCRGFVHGWCICTKWHEITKRMGRLISEIVPEN